ncbi:ferritin-like domain-containing protein [Mucilaginibacter limnophilus]|uniref:Ferritin-like domain-containing protein n=1 Tax=Mucilaginibacter limnophilus TaxID=1932778 RepID=A0A3S3TGJ5_9SPHI|nr:ferritin-like domain-containing protein [Mucilaginibacter limnophilus]RVU00547.1 ferritin-like domain-containing protein [Mucilaginibacter limnophilus]
MNLFNIIEEIEKVDPEIADRMNPRRSAIKNITSFGSKVAAAALPFALGTMFKKAYAQTGGTAADVANVLNFALTLEYLESSFYNIGLDKGGLIPTADRNNYISKISRDEDAHVLFLKSVIKDSLKQQPVDRASLQFDFTGGNGSNDGPFATVFSDYATFLKVATAFEDTGVRAYKGQAPALLGNQVVLTAALSIHAVEARHAAALRHLLHTKFSAALKPWIESTATAGNDTGISQVNGNYDKEQNVTHLGVDVTTLPETGNSADVRSATAAFDEPLTRTEVEDLLIGSFIVSNAD